IRPLEGEAYSAFGVGRADGGIHLVLVPSGSRAARAGLRTNDVVQQIDGQPVRNMEQLKASPQPAAGAPIRIDYVREQKAAHLKMTAGDGKDPLKQLEATQ
ncbi:MAG: site-2 protease family protein, partial [Patescibacteria group bacterium]|nr:site-2 protease family protein [Patescibacteria group bacterium]